MPSSGWDQDGIAGRDEALFAIDLHGALTFQDKIKLLAELVVVALSGTADGDGGLGEALVLHGSVRAVEKAADGAAVLGGEGFLLGKRVDGHAGTVVGLQEVMANGFSFHKVRAVITGASSGLGAEFARQLAPQADLLVLVARRAEALEEVRRGLPRGAGQVECVVADLGTEAGRQGLLAEIEARGLRPNLLINNAGLGDYGPLVSAPVEKLQLMLEVNVAALTLITRRMLPNLEAGSGILNVSSLASTLPMPELAVYAATKAYVTSFSEALAIELMPRDITVTCVCPGPTPTNFSRTAKREDGTDTNRDGQALLRISPHQVVAEALAGLAAGRACVFPGKGVKVAARLFRLMPRALLRLILRRRTGQGSM